MVCVCVCVCVFVRMCVYVCVCLYVCMFVCGHWHTMHTSWSKLCVAPLAHGRLMVGSWLTHGKCGMCAQSPQYPIRRCVLKPTPYKNNRLTFQNEPTPYSQERRIVSAKQVLLPTRVPHGPLAFLQHFIFLVVVCQQPRNTAQHLTNTIG